MRYFCILLLLFAFAPKLYAQAPVTDTSWLPNVGDKYNVYRIGYTQTTNPFIDVKDTGENITWNYNDKYFNLLVPADSVLYTLPSNIYVKPHNPEVNLAT